MVEDNFGGTDCSGNGNHCGFRRTELRADLHHWANSLRLLNPSGLYSLWRLVSSMDCADMPKWSRRERFHDNELRPRGRPHDYVSNLLSPARAPRSVRLMA